MFDVVYGRNEDISNNLNRILVPGGLAYIALQDIRKEIREHAAGL